MAFDKSVSTLPPDELPRESYRFLMVTRGPRNLFDSGSAGQIMRSDLTETAGRQAYTTQTIAVPEPGSYIAGNVGFDRIFMFDQNAIEASQIVPAMNEPWVLQRSHILSSSTEVNFNPLQPWDERFQPIFNHALAVFSHVHPSLRQELAAAFEDALAVLSRLTSPQYRPISRVNPDDGDLEMKVRLNGYQEVYLEISQDGDIECAIYDTNDGVREVKISKPNDLPSAMRSTLGS